MKGVYKRGRFSVCGRHASVEGEAREWKGEEKRVIISQALFQVLLCPFLSVHEIMAFFITIA